MGDLTNSPAAGAAAGSNPYLGLASAGIGLFNSLLGPANQPIPDLTQPTINTPMGSQIYNPISKSYETVMNVDPADVSQSAMADLYRQKLMGTGDFSTWQSGLQSQIADLQSKLGQSSEYLGEGGGAMTYDEYLAEHGLTREDVKKQPMGEDIWGRQYEFYKTNTGEPLANLTDAQREAYTNELTALQDLLASQQDFSLPYGSLQGPSEERQMQIGELTGSLQDLLTQSAEKSYSNQLADLARRGITGGTAEFDLGEKQAQTSADIANQAAMLGDQIKKADYETTRSLLNQIENGLDTDVAQSMMQQQALWGQQYGQQQLAAQQAYQQQLLAQQEQQALQNSLAALGQGLGGVNWGGLFGGGGNQTGLQQMANDPFSFLNRYPIP